MIDPDPGTMTLALAGQTITLKMTHEALKEIQQRLGGERLMTTLRRMVQQQDIGIDDCVHIIAASIIGHGPSSEEEIGRLVLQEGVAETGVRLAEFLALAAAGFRHLPADAEGNGRGRKGRTTTPSAG